MKKIKQLSLFDVVEISVENEFWEIFKKIVEKLKKEGCRSIDETWWRSRYYEYVACPGHSPNKKGFEYQDKAFKSWKFIWTNHQLEIIKR